MSEDQFAVKVSVGEKQENVVLEFDGEIRWIALTPLQALDLAERLKTEAIKILRSDVKPAIKNT